LRFLPPTVEGVVVVVVVVVGVDESEVNHPDAELAFFFKEPNHPSPLESAPSPLSNGQTPPRIVLLLLFLFGILYYIIILEIIIKFI
jgi:hypothetical protein